MKIRYDVEVPREKRRTKYNIIVDEFLASDQKIAEIVPDAEKPITLYSGLYQHIKRRGCNNISVLRRGDRVYMVKPSDGGE